MSQGPLGLVAGTLCAVPACCAIASVAPVTVSASASIGARLILIFMVGVGPLRVRDQFSLKLAAGIRIPLVLKGFRAVSGVCLRKRILCFDHVHGMAGRLAEKSIGFLGRLQRTCGSAQSLQFLL